MRSRLQPIALRIGVGIGDVSGRVAAPVNEMDGAAFRAARQALDRLQRARKEGAFTAFRSASAEFDQTANLIYALHDTLVRKMTQKQWDTVTARIEHASVEKTARALRLDASTVSRNLKRGHYGQLVAAAVGVEQLIGERFAEPQRSNTSRGRGTPREET